MSAYDEAGQAPPSVGGAVLKRALLAMLMVALLSGAAISAYVFREVDDVTHAFLGPGRQQIVIPEIDKAAAGGARTILILGSDERYADKKTGAKPRSDTILLVRADPNKSALAVTSIPRDLKAEIPGHGSDKINAAFEDGGPRLTVRTVKKLFEDATGKPFPINNVITVNFDTFQRAVDYVHGVYVDIDRRYYNDNTGATTLDQRYAAINIQPGYQKLYGTDALAYVRYRHTDNDFIRAARQQDFLRQARGQAGVKRLFAISDRVKLARAFGRYFQVDSSFRSRQEIFSMMRLALYLIQQHPVVNQVRFRADAAPNPVLDTRLFASSDEVRKTYDEFMNAQGSAKPIKTSAPTAQDKAQRKLRSKENRNRLASVPGLEDATSQGRNQAVLADPKLNFPFYYPKLRTIGASYAGTQPRIYTIKDERGKPHQAYRLVVSKGLIGEYYGVQGMTWKAPPILDNPDATTTVGGRKFLLFEDGRRLRIVAWKTPHAAYWIANTLSESLSKRQMLAIAASMTHLKQ